jgi:hypothetical protein
MRTWKERKWNGNKNIVENEHNENATMGKKRKQNKRKMRKLG